MAYTDSLTTARDNMSTVLAEITASPKPSYQVGGQQMSWTEYQESLLKNIENINRLLAQASPFEIVGIGR